MITRPEESYWLWCVVVCDLETSWIRRPWPTGGCRAEKQQTTRFNTKKLGIFPALLSFLWLAIHCDCFPITEWKTDREKCEIVTEVWNITCMICRYQGRAVVADPYHGGLFHSRLFHVRFVVVKVVLGKVLLRGLRFSPFSIIPPIPHTDLYLSTTTATPGQEGEAWEPSDKAMLFRISGIIAHKSTYTFFTGFKYQNQFNYDIRKKKRGYNEYNIRTFLKVYWSQLIYPLGDIDLLITSIADYVPSRSMCRTVLFYFDTFISFST